MAKPKLFIDGEHGTTGLQISERLAGRGDLDFIRLGDDERKDAHRRAEALNEADFAILCLPDDAAKEAVALTKNNRTRIIDASSAHRTAPGWVYGFPEMTRDQPRLIAESNRLTNPGCYPTGGVGLLRPLIQRGLVPKDYPIAINAISGYSGGGKAMIAAFEDASAQSHTDVPFRLYSLGQEHKHIEEIRFHAGLDHRPLFAPSYGRFAQGMLVSVPLTLWALPGQPKIGDVHSVLAEAYDGEAFVEVAPLEECVAIGAAPSLDARNPAPDALNGTNRMRLYVFGSDKREQAVLVSQLDNLGKGASGQAVQCLDLMLAG